MIKRVRTSPYYDTLSRTPSSYQSNEEASTPPTLSSSHLDDGRTPNQKPLVDSTLQRAGGGIRRTWDDAKDLALVQCFMHNRSKSSAVMSRQTSSVWRKIVRTVFGSSLQPYDEREVSDSARHRLTKLRSYAAQIQRLLQTVDRLFRWDDNQHRLVVNTDAGHDPQVTWNKIQNSQIRKRLMSARYPWFSLLPVTEKDLPSTFYSTVLPLGYFRTRSSVGSSEQQEQVPSSSPTTQTITRHEDRWNATTPVTVPPSRPHFTSTVSYSQQKNQYYDSSHYYYAEPPRHLPAPSTSTFTPSPLPLPTLHQSVPKPTIDPSHHSVVGVVPSYGGYNVGSEHNTSTTYSPPVL